MSVVNYKGVATWSSNLYLYVREGPRISEFARIMNKVAVLLQGAGEERRASVGGGDRGGSGLEHDSGYQPPADGGVRHSGSKGAAGFGSCRLRRRVSRNTRRIRGGFDVTIMRNFFWFIFKLVHQLGFILRSRDIIYT